MIQQTYQNLGTDLGTTKTMEKLSTQMSTIPKWKTLWNGMCVINKR